jgi:hypothetical protein
MDVRKNCHVYAFLHCGKCLEEWKAGEGEGQSPEEYSRLSAGFTAAGLQVYCFRHELNVLHVDFEGQRHPGDKSAEGDFS